jgi:hypothetical protein
MKYFLVLLTGIFFTTLAYSQDIIIKRNGSQIKGKVVEVGTTEIKYKLPDNLDGPLYAVDKNSISKIIYENGRVENLVNDIKDPENYAGQLKRAIKFDFLGPLIGYSQFSYEQNKGVGKSYELSLGIIGLGKSSQLGYYDSTMHNVKRKQFGLFASAGYKFNKWPDFLFGRTRFSHIMQGAYAKPVFYLGNYSENQIVYKGSNYNYVAERQNITFAALQIEFGKQWVFGDKFLMDIYWGLGYGFDNKNKQNNNYYEDNTSAFNYVNARIGKSPGFSTTFGIKAGLLIK